MAEEVILSAIEKFKTWPLEDSRTVTGFDKERMTRFIKEMTEGVQTELTLILDLIKNSTLSRNKLLSYLVADVVEIANDIQVIRDTVLRLFWFFEMQQTRRSLRKIKSRMLRLGGEGGRGTEPPTPLALPKVGDIDVVGLKETVESLLSNNILKKRKRPPANGPYTCCIMGVGGIGKTTLARELYHHEAVAAHFQHRAWVRISGVMSNKQVLMELIMQVAEGEGGFELLEEMDNGSLQKMLQQHLKNKPHFIVLDDVDENTYMRSILKALPKDKVSTLLLTSQCKETKCDHSHVMEFLDDDKSWQLFLKTVFCGNTSGYKFPRQLEKRARKMLTQCGGLPLAIIEVGRQLAVKRQSGSEWEELLESPLDFTQTLISLEFSYHRLPPKAKLIFLCLCFFSEGTTIRVEKLLGIVIAQRVINWQYEGEDALHELKRQSFVEIINMTKADKPKNLQIKTIFHRLSVKRAEEEINFEIVRNEGNSSSSGKPSHRAIYCSREKFNYSTNEDEHLVSLFFRGGGYFDASPSYWKSLEQLIILDMEGFGLRMVPDEIGTLTRLRYLGLRNNHIKRLPLSLRCLKNLEVLDIALNFRVEVPDIIWEMDSLRHLYMSNILCLEPLRIDALENLETLTYVSAENWTYEISGLELMNKLRKVGMEEVDCMSNISKLFASLAKVKNLEDLTLRGSRFKSMPLLDDLGVLQSLTTLKLDGLLKSLPSSRSFPPKIRYLTLVNSSLHEDPMPILEKLSNLYFLKLQNAYTGQQMAISHDGFKSLNVLCIKEMWHLREIQVRKVGKWRLYLLEINDCPYLETLPEVSSKRKGFKIVTNNKNCMKHKGRC